VADGAPVDPIRRASLAGVSTSPTPAQQAAVLLAFIAAALSFSAVAYSFIRTGAIQATPLFGGLLMLALAVSGYSRLRRPPS
jgi:hypothetical protein